MKKWTKWIKSWTSVVFYSLRVGGTLLYLTIREVDRVLTKTSSEEFNADIVLLVYIGALVVVP